MPPQQGERSPDRFGHRLHFRTHRAFLSCRRLREMAHYSWPLPHMRTLCHRGVARDRVSGRRYGTAHRMTTQWQYQLRFDLDEPAMAEAVRRHRPEPVLAPLLAILAKHRAVPKCQLDAFAYYVAAAEAEG